MILYPKCAIHHELCILTGSVTLAHIWRLAGGRFQPHPFFLKCSFLCWIIKRPIVDRWSQLYVYAEPRMKAGACAYACVWTLFLLYLWKGSFLCNMLLVTLKYIQDVVQSVQHFKNIIIMVTRGASVQCDVSPHRTASKCVCGQAVTVLSRGQWNNMVHMSEAGALTGRMQEESHWCWHALAELW